MITSNTEKPFGGKVATIETPSFSCFISTAKDAFSKNQSMVIFDTTGGFTNRQVAAKVIYNDLLDSNARLGLHDAIIHTIDESGMNGVTLIETLITLFEGLQKEGIGTPVIDEAWANLNDAVRPDLTPSIVAKDVKLQQNKLEQIVPPIEISEMTEQLPPRPSPQQSTVTTTPIEKNKKHGGLILFSWQSAIIALVIAILGTGLLGAAVGTKVPPMEVFWTWLWIQLTIEGWKYLKWKTLLPFPMVLFASYIAFSNIDFNSLSSLNSPSSIWFVGIGIIINIGGIIFFYLYIKKSQKEIVVESVTAKQSEPLKMSGQDGEIWGWIRENKWIVIGITIIAGLIFSQIVNDNKGKEPAPAEAPKVEAPIAQPAPSMEAPAPAPPYSGKDSIRSVTYIPKNKIQKQLPKRKREDNHRQNQKMKPSDEVKIPQTDVSVTRSPEKQSQTSAENARPSVNADQHYKGIKGIVLMNGNKIEGQIISMNPDTVKIRTKDGNILSYDFKKEVESFIHE